MKEIKVLNIKRLDNAGNLKAFVDFKLGESEFYSWRIVQQPGQVAWLSSPVETWESDDGKKHYKQLIKFPQVLMDQIRDIIIKEWEDE